LAPRRRIRQFANQDEPVKVDARSSREDETPEEAADRERKHLCADWLLQIKLAEQRNERWEKRCERIIRRYREERPSGDGSTSGGVIAGQRRMNVLWSNVQTLKPCVYGRQPVPIAERRFLDRDDTGRIGSQILERALRYEMNFCGFHDTVEQAVDDYLLVARGVAWLRYKPIIGQASSMTDMGDDELGDKEGEPADNDDQPDYEADEQAMSTEPTSEIPEEKLLSASLEVDYVFWKDFLHSKARFWKENTWVARRLYPSRKDLIDDFGEKVGKEVPLEMTPEETRQEGAEQKRQQAPDSLKKAIVYEIWDKPTRKVYTIAKGYDDFLEDPRDDPLNLENFFPCPKPLFGTMTNDTLEPVPDYIEYQDQALEIDQLTNRIDLLISALKVAGVYDASQKQLARLLDEGNENRLIPVSNWAAFAEKGGLDKAISFLPIKEVAEVLNALFEAREKVKQDMFEITGLADVIRGQADPRETAEAVATKGKWGSLRLQARQANVARFCRDIIAMMGEIVSEHFPEKTLIDVSGALFDEGIGGPAPVAPKPPQMPPQGAAPPQLGGPQPPLALPPPGAPQGPQSPIHQAPQPSSSPMLSAGPPALAPSAPSGAAPGVAAPNPQMIFAAQMAAYQQAVQAHEMQKMLLIKKAIDLLRQDKLRGFRIDIETDSTINQEATEDKRAVTEFIAATTQFLEQAFPIGAQVPDAVPMLGKMLLMGVRRFKAGRDLESTIEDFVEKMEKDAQQKANSPPAPNPEQQKAMVELQTTQAKAQAEVQKAQIDAKASAEDNARDMAAKQADAELNRQKMQLDMMQMQEEFRIKQQEAAVRLREMEMKLAIAEREHAHKMEFAHVSHQQALEKLREPKPIGAKA
jgi:hypothetical protein